MPAGIRDPTRSLPDDSEARGPHGSEGSQGGGCGLQCSWLDTASLSSCPRGTLLLLNKPPSGPFRGLKLSAAGAQRVVDQQPGALVVIVVIPGVPAASGGLQTLGEQTGICPSAHVLGSKELRSAVPWLPSLGV